MCVCVWGGGDEGCLGAKRLVSASTVRNDPTNIKGRNSDKITRTNVSESFSQNFRSVLVNHAFLCSEDWEKSWCLSNLVK